MYELRVGAACWALCSGCALEALRNSDPLSYRRCQMSVACRLLSAFFVWPTHSRRLQIVAGYIGNWAVGRLHRKHRRYSSPNLYRSFFLPAGTRVHVALPSASTMVYADGNRGWGFGSKLRDLGFGQRLGPWV